MEDYVKTLNNGHTSLGNVIWSYLIGVAVIFIAVLALNSEVRATTLNDIHVEFEEVTPRGATVGPSATIEFVFRLQNTGEVQRTVVITPEWSRNIRQATIAAGQSAEITFHYQVSPTVDFGGRILTPSFVIEVGAAQETFSSLYAVEEAPGARLDVSIRDNAIPTIGAAITVLVRVTNTGNMPMNNIVIEHSVAPDVRMNHPVLVPGESRSFSSRIIVSSGMIQDGLFRNMVLVSADECVVEPFLFTSNFLGTLDTTDTNEGTGPMGGTPTPAPTPQPTVSPTATPVPTQGAVTLAPTTTPLANAVLPKTGDGTYQTRRMMIIGGAALFVCFMVIWYIFNTKMRLKKG
jgi:uncharacterized repeat protein (TIGR01451 family)